MNVVGAGHARDSDLAANFAAMELGIPAAPLIG